IQPFALHCATTAARHAPHFDFEKNPKSCARQVANLSHPPVVPAVPDPPATATNRFFERRSSRTIRTSGSPNTPRTVAFARKPANEYPSDRRRGRFPDLAISQHAKIEPPSKPRKVPIHKHFRRYDPSKSPTRFPEDPEKTGQARRACNLKARGSCAACQRREKAAPQNLDWHRYRWSSAPWRPKCRWE